MKTTHRKKMKVSASKYACNYKKNAYICIGDINLIVTPLYSTLALLSFTIQNMVHPEPHITVHTVPYFYLFTFSYHRV